jgi:soluble lytic murein transglycosylase
MKRNYRLIFSSVLIILLAGCNLPKPTPAPPTPTVGPSPTPTVAPSPTASPIPLPTPTPPPGVRIGAGEKAIFDGNSSQARLEFQAALSSNTDDNVRAKALWGMSKNDYLEENFSSALENLRQLTQFYPNVEEGIHGWFLLGETYYSLNRFQEAADAFQKYLELRPGLLDAYVQKKRGDAFSALGDQSNAQKAYQASEQADGQNNLIAIRIDIANTYLNSGDPENALKIFDEIFAATSNDYVKAQMDLQSGQALLALNRVDEGYGRWRHAVENYPLAYDSYSALVGLIDAGQQVSQFDRGLVDYYAQKYDVALRAFQVYASENPNHDGTVLHYLALTLREMGDFNAAIEMWDRLIEKYPGNRYWATAWDEKSTTQWVYLDNYSGAANTLETFASETSGSPYASTYLFDAARIYERSGNLEKAASLWESLPDRFDQDPSAGNAWFQAGIARYRLKNYPRANNDFQQALLLVKELPDRARALLWIGKTYATSGDMKNARSAWEQAQTTDPNGYYSLRSKDLLENRQPFAAPPSMNLNFDLKTERNEAAAWLRIKFDLPAGTDLNGPGAFGSNPYFRRGAEFWNMGLFDEARLEFEALRENLKTNPADSFRLGNYLLDIGAYRSGIYALREVLTMAGYDDHSLSLTAPVYFKHVRYGLYYQDLVWPAAQENALDPLFVSSVVRQESLFEGFVRSTAGARGLMQIIASTGSSIATQMGWPPDFSPDDLYSPYINIRLGTYYLNANRRLLSGDLYATLAAYNGGPGNASIWQGLANGDLDLELEIIRYGETRDYIRSIYETYYIYRGLYSPMR